MKRLLCLVYIIILLQLQAFAADWTESGKFVGSVITTIESGMSSIVYLKTDHSLWIMSDNSLSDGTAQNKAPFSVTAK